MKRLLSIGVDAKTVKSAKKTSTMVGILRLSPAEKAKQYYKLPGMHNLCPGKSPGCEHGCLDTSGRGEMNSVQLARLKRTKWFFTDRTSFLRQIWNDIEFLIRKAKRAEMSPAVRLNGTSDINWYHQKLDGKTVFDAFPAVQFYDYTKILNYTRNPAKNHHFTFSRSEDNWKQCKRALDLGVNVAVVFSGKVLPKTWEGREVIDGDAHDSRFMDKRGGLIVGLLAKGKAKKDTSGFVVKAATNNI